MMLSTTRGPTLAWNLLFSSSSSALFAEAIFATPLVAEPL